MQRNHRTTDSWFGLDPEITKLLDPLLEKYEEDLKSGLRPDRQTILDEFASEQFYDLLKVELDHYDDYFRYTVDARLDDTNRNDFEQFGAKPPEMIGDFRVIQTIGRGGFGVVLLAEHTLNKQRMALKIAHPGWLVEGSAQNLAREADALAKLQHPGIVRFYEAMWTNDGLWVICTEWIDGKNLEDVLKTDELKVQDKVGIVLQLLAALTYAHKRGIIHRDIKPRNVMIDSSGQVKLLDFGMAKIFDDPGFSQNGQLKGSIAYMSPEQADGDVRATDARSDVFAVGVMLYEMLAGRRPFSGTENEMREAIVDARFEDLNLAAPDVPETLVNICHKALARRQQERFQSAAAFSNALQLWQRGETVPDLSVPSRDSVGELVSPLKPPAQKPNRRFAGMIYQSLMAIAAILLFGMIAYQFWFAPAEPDVLANRVSGASAQPEFIAATEYSTVDENAEPVNVSLETYPTNAIVTFVPLTNWHRPVLDDRIDAGVSPVNVVLQPGNYLVVAEMGDGTFVEVHRNIPFPGQKSNEAFKHFQFDRIEDRIKLSSIDIIVPDTSKMSRCDDILYDETLVSKEDFYAVNSDWVSQQHNHLQIDPDSPMTFVTWDMAIAYCEKKGTRLPSVLELDNALAEGVIEISPTYFELTTNVLPFKTAGVVDPTPPQLRTWPSENYDDISEGFSRSTTIPQQNLGFRSVRSVFPITNSR